MVKLRYIYMRDIMLLNYVFKLCGGFKIFIIKKSDLCVIITFKSFEWERKQIQQNVRKSILGW